MYNASSAAAAAVAVAAAAGLRYFPDVAVAVAVVIVVLHHRHHQLPSLLKIAVAFDAVANVAVEQLAVADGDRLEKQY